MTELLVRLITLDQVCWGEERNRKGNIKVVFALSHAASLKHINDRPNTKATDKAIPERQLGRDSIAMA